MAGVKVLSWNVNGTFPPQGSPDSIQEQVEWVESLDPLPDILLLQEVNPNRRELWYDSLQNGLGYAQLRDTIDWARELDNSNGHITAVAGDWNLSKNQFGRSERADVDELRTEFPEKILITDIEYAGTEIELWNVRAVPGSDYPEEKVKILELIYDRIENDGRKPRILAGAVFS